VQNSALPRPSAAEPEPHVAEGSLRDTELIPSVPALSIVPALAFLLALGGAFLWQSGGGREVEFFGAGIALLVAYFVPRWPAVLAAIAALADVVVIENRHQRFDVQHFWQLAFYGIAILMAALCSTYVGRSARRQRTELRRTIEGAAITVQNRTFEDLLSGPSRIGSLDYELNRSRRHTHTFGLLIVQPDAVGRGVTDIDREETMGAMAEVIGSASRATDVAFLSDEYSYCIILPETGAEGSRVAAERIRLSLVATASGPYGDLSASVGVAVFPDDASSNDALIDAAKRALDRAVELGGNRTVLATAPEEAPAGWGLVESPREPA
jgi:GGDEF domain-containing protein